jgi:hypothetical protein
MKRSSYVVLHITLSLIFEEGVKVNNITECYAENLNGPSTNDGKHGVGQ